MLSQLWKPGCDFLGVDYAIMGGAMTWVSERNLVSAISNAGGFGVLASGAMSPEILRNEIQATQALTSRPFGVNLITLHPQLTELMHVCIQEKISHVILAGGIPAVESITLLKNSGIRVVCFAPALSIAKKLIKFGTDALILEGMEAGGHVGPVSTTVLVQEILPHIHAVPIFVAGGIGRGEAIISYLRMGAAGCQLGTRFVCSHESQVHPKFKQAFLRGNAREATISLQLDPRFPVIPVRALENKGKQDFMKFQKEVIDRFIAGDVTQKEGQLEIEHYWAGALRRAVIDGDIENGSVMAGQSVGMVIQEQSVAEIIQDLVTQARKALEEK